MKRRIEWIDLSKFVGIFVMVWGHSGVSENVDIAIHAFHMPLFFFLSGYLYKDGQQIKKKTKTLLIPYFVFGIVLFLVWRIIDKIITLPVFYSFSDLFKGLLYDNAMVSPYAGVQWFLTGLFLTEVLFYLIKRFVKTNIGILLILILFSIIGFIYPLLTEKRMFWALDCALTAIVFYGVGFLIRSCKNYISKLMNNTLIKFPVIAALILLSVFATYMNGYVNMRTLQYNNYFFYYLSAFSIIGLIVLLARRISEINIIKSNYIYKGVLYIGQNTLIVLVMNQFFNQLFRWFIKPHIYTLISNQYIVDFVFAIIIILLMIPVSYIINRFFPFVLGKSKK